MMMLAGLMTAAPAAETGESAADNQRALIAVLTSDAPPAEKAITCKRLAIHGTREAVPALAPLLSDPQLASWARIALEAIPDPAAADALREAMSELQGRLLIGAINSIGVRRDAKAVPALAEKLRDRDPDVVAAAADALGRIGGDPAAKSLMPMLASAPAAVRPDVAYGCILCAEHLLAAGRNDEAARMYGAIRDANVSRQRTIEATRGLILARQSAGIPLLLDLLRSPNPKMYRLGLRVARELSGPEVDQALLAELGRAAADRRPHLLLALADRGGDDVLPAALKAAGSGPTELRSVAIGVLERLGGAAAVPALLAVAAGEDAESAQAAKLALVRQPGAGVDAAAVSMLKDPESTSRRLAVDLLTQRQVAAAVPALLEAAHDPDGQVRLAALKGLAGLAGPGELRAVLDLLVNGQSPAEIQAAEGAVTAICLRSAKPVAGSIVIVKAVYGDLPGGPSADVTGKVAAIVESGATTVTASNSDFGDPAGGVVKKLRVDYKVNGRAVSKTVNENDSITLAADVVSPVCADAVFAALPGARGASKLALLRILRSIGGKRALEAVLAATSDADPEIRNVATRALCDWPDVEALPSLAQLAKTSPSPIFKILALRGYVRLAGRQDAATGQKLATLKNAMEMAGRSEEKKLVLAALGSIHTADALALVRPYLDNPEVREEAGLAAVAIAENIPPPRPALVARTMQQVAKVTTNEQLARRARALAGE